MITNQSGTLFHQQKAGNGLDSEKTPQKKVTSSRSFNFAIVFLVACIIFPLLSQFRLHIFCLITLLIGLLL